MGGMVARCNVVAGTSRMFGQQWGGLQLRGVGVSVAPLVGPRGRLGDDILFSVASAGALRSDFTVNSAGSNC